VFYSMSSHIYVASVIGDVISWGTIFIKHAVFVRPIYESCGVGACGGVWSLRLDEISDAILRALKKISARILHHACFTYFPTPCIMEPYAEQLVPLPGTLRRV
jgi:hypothetical protein